MVAEVIGEVDGDDVKLNVALEVLIRIVDKGVDVIDVVTVKLLDDDKVVVCELVIVSVLELVIEVVGVQVLVVGTVLVSVDEGVEVAVTLTEVVAVLVSDVLTDVEIVKEGVVVRDEDEDVVGDVDSVKVNELVMVVVLVEVALLESLVV